MYRTKTTSTVASTRKSRRGAPVEAEADSVPVPVSVVEVSVPVPVEEVVKTKSKKNSKKSKKSKSDKSDMPPPASVPVPVVSAPEVATEAYMPPTAPVQVPLRMNTSILSNNSIITSQSRISNATGSSFMMKPRGGAIIIPKLKARK